MVNGSEKINNRLIKIFEKFKKEEMAGRKRFYLDDLKQFIINYSRGLENYKELGGYQGLYQLIKYMEIEGEIIPIKSSKLNGRSPALRSRWQLNNEPEQSWDDKTVFMLGNKLDISYYLKRPELQTPKLLTKLKQVYHFLSERESREWASREERSLELFGDEKFLTSTAGKRLLSRLKINLADLKCEKYNQMFVYWRHKPVIKNILILENHSAFIACKRALSDGYSIFSRTFDTLIYGAGNHITKSLEFLEEITDTKEVKIYYAGDLDPSGLAIYHYLKNNYPDYQINLFGRYYVKMLEYTEEGYLINTEQNKRNEVLNLVCEEISEIGVNRKTETPWTGPKAVEKIKELWNNNLRIPQEVITYELIKQNNI